MGLGRIHIVKASLARSLYPSQSLRVRTRMLLFAILIVSSVAQDPPRTHTTDLLSPISTTKYPQIISNNRRNIATYFNAVTTIRLMARIRSPEIEWYSQFVVDFQHKFVICNSEPDQRDNQHTIVGVGEYEAIVMVFHRNEVHNIRQTKLHPSGRYLILSEVNFNESQLRATALLEDMWTHVRSTTLVMVFPDAGMHIYNPFRRTSRSRYGALEPFDIAVDYGRQLVANLNGYPLRLDVFDSSFTIPMTKSVNGKKVVQYYYGPDKDTIDVLCERMNFTGKSRILMINRILEVKIKIAF